ncbi:MAG: hypothetical protein QXX47_04510, partial [Sulfolobales archaeon]
LCQPSVHGLVSLKLVGCILIFDTTANSVRASGTVFTATPAIFKAFIFLVFFISITVTSFYYSL